MIDTHSHILPGVDDGSSCLEESMEMLRREAAQGVTRVVATPHFYAHHDDLDRFLERTANAEALLRSKMAEEKGLPKLSVGAEVYFFQGISDSELINRLTFDKKSCILIEMTQAPWGESAYKELEGIAQKQQLVPIIAHVDRYIRPFRTGGIPERLAELPVLVQANAEFFLEKTTRRMAMRMLNREGIHLLGSDCHNLKDRKPNLGEAVKEIRRQLGSEAIAWIRHYEQEVFECVE